MFNSKLVVYDDLVGLPIFAKGDVKDKNEYKINAGNKEPAQIACNGQLGCIERTCYIIFKHHRRNDGQNYQYQRRIKYGFIDVEFKVFLRLILLGLR